MQALLADLWSEHMEGLPFEIPLFLLATFAGAVVAGLSGFAFGLVAASLWLYILTPLQSATLIVAFGLIVRAIRSGNCGAPSTGRSFGRLSSARHSVCRLV
jgi:thiamine transporter ThiT